MATLGTFTAGQVLTAAELNAIGTWQDFPAGKGFGGITVGNGDLYQKYCEINEIVLFVASFTLGSTSALSNASFDLPVGVSSDGQRVPLSFSAGLSDDSTAYGAMVRWNGVSQVLIRAINTAGTYASQSVISATVPFTWTTGDRIAIQGMYEKA